MPMQPPPLPGKASENPPQPPIDQIQAFLDLYYISWFRINRTYNLWAQCHGIQDSTMFLLDEIHRNPEYCTQSMLVEKVLLPKQTVSSALKKLEEEGIIHRENNPCDKRNKLVKLTVPKGKAYADALMREMEQAEVDAFLSLTPAQQTAITSGLEAFANAIEQAFGKTMQKKKKR